MRSHSQRSNSILAPAMPVTVRELRFWWRSTMGPVRRKFGYIVGTAGQTGEEGRPCYQSGALFIREIVPLIDADDAGKRAACMVQNLFNRRQGHAKPGHF